MCAVQAEAGPTIPIDPESPNFGVFNEGIAQAIEEVGCYSRVSCQSLIDRSNGFVRSVDLLGEEVERTDPLESLRALARVLVMDEYRADELAHTDSKRARYGA